MGREGMGGAGHGLLLCKHQGAAAPAERPLAAASVGLVLATLWRLLCRV